MGKYADITKMTVDERLQQIADMTQMSESDIEILKKKNALSLETADSMIDHVIGTYALPIGVARGFVINGKEYVVPMVCEEPWVVSCAEKGALLAAECGGFKATHTGSVMISQIQLTGIKNIETCSMMILEHKAEVLAKANEADPVLVSMGGGAFEVETRPLQTEEGPMVIVHLLVDTKDAMGANAVNTMAEKVAPLLTEITGGRPYLRILSNLAVHRLARVRVHVTKEVLGGEAVVDGVLQAYAFANNDPYRACTNNKGIMNGSSPVACATGNDIRALEAGAHAYAGISGHYRPIVHWEKDNNGDLNGMIELPTAVGIVGGTTKTHPPAGVMLRMMHVESAEELSIVIAATGLAENLWTLRTLATGGIQAEFVPSLERRQETEE